MESVTIPDYFMGKITDDSLIDLVVSGGAISALLLYLIEQKLVDAAVVTHFGANNPWEPKPILARN